LNHLGTVLICSIRDGPFRHANPSRGRYEETG
jgi:hypothetical protein